MKENFSRDLAELLVDDFKKAIDYLDKDHKAQQVGREGGRVAELSINLFVYSIMHALAPLPPPPPSPPSRHFHFEGNQQGRLDHCTPLYSPFSKPRNTLIDKPPPLPSFPSSLPPSQELIIKAQDAGANRANFMSDMMDVLKGRARRARNIFHDGAHRTEDKGTKGVC